MSLLGEVANGFSRLVEAINALKNYVDSRQGGVPLEPGDLMYFSEKTTSGRIGFLPLSSSSNTFIDTASYPQLVGKFSAGIVGSQKITVNTSLVTQSSMNSNWSAARLFDGSNADGSNVLGFNPSQIGNRWVVVDFGVPEVLVKSIYTQRTAAGDNMQQSQTQVSENGVDWINIGSVVALNQGGSAQTTINHANTSAYRYFRLLAEATGYACLGELELYRAVFSSGSTVIVPMQPKHEGFKPYLYIGT